MKINITKMIIKGYPLQLRVNFSYLIPHNTAGNASAKQEALRLQSSSQYNNGNAHYWVDEKDIYLIIDPKYISWNAGVWEINTKSISIELCKSKGNLDNFKVIEKRAIELMAYLLKQNNSGVSKIFLHSDFYATACPHRSQSIHGKGSTTRNFFRKEVNNLLKKNTEKEVVVMKASQLLENHGRIVLPANRALYDKIPKKKTPFKKVIEEGAYFYNGLYTYKSYKGVDSQGRKCAFVQIRDLNNNKLLGFAPVYSSDQLFRSKKEQIKI